MKLILKHISIRSTNAIDSWIQNQVSSLLPQLPIQEARVRLVHEHKESPAFRVQVRLVAPGPDVVAESRDHTLPAAVGKVMAQLRSKIQHRTTRRLQCLKNRLAGSLSLAHGVRGGH